jgi:MFS family permease
MVHHLDVPKMSVVTVIPWVVGVVGSAASGFVVDAIFRRTGQALLSRKIILIGGLLVAAVFLALAGMASSVVLAVAAMAGAWFCRSLTVSCYWTIILDTVEAPRVGGVSGFVHLIANLAGVVAPSVTGFLVQTTHSFASAFILAGVIAVVGALGVSVFVRESTDAPAAVRGQAAA